MRMWKVNVRKMCRQHLLGEHLEMHMFASNIKSGKSLKGYIKNKLVEVHNIKKRHDELVKEMKSRGYKHKSPMKDFKKHKAGKINVCNNVVVLKKRCKKCRKLLKK